MSATSPHGSRIEDAQRRLASVEGDVLVLFPGSNLTYLIGFDEEPAERHLFLLLTPDDYRLFAPSMYEEQLLDETVAQSIATWADGDDPITCLEEVFEALDIPRTPSVFVDDRLFAHFLLDLQMALDAPEFELASDVIGPMRMIKDEHELEALRLAAAYSDRASEHLRELGSDIVGCTEREVVALLEEQIDAIGGQGFSFDPIVGAGPNGAHPHYRHGDRTIESGDPVVLDFGTQVDGYPGDQTRTIVFDGEPPSEFEEVYEVVLAAFEAAVQTVGPGVPAEAVDAAARDVIEQAGYGDRFLHRTGHGIGLDVHEPPYIVAGNEMELRPGMVHSIEPGIYLEEAFGVRIEDIVVVTEDGCDRLNDSPKSWVPSG